MTNTRTYLGVVERGEESYGIVFPDFAGCISAGDTLDHVLAMGKEALTFHIEGMIEDGDPLPPPGNISLDGVRAEFPEGNWIVVAAISVPVPASPDTVQIPVKFELVRQIAELAEATASKIDSRRFIEQAVEHEIERYRKSAA